jgi:hypothetical protein
MATYLFNTLLALLLSTSMSCATGPQGEYTETDFYRISFTGVTVALMVQDKHDDFELKNQILDYLTMVDSLLADPRPDIPSILHLLSVDMPPKYSMYLRSMTKLMAIYIQPLSTSEKPEDQAKAVRFISYAIEGAREALISSSEKARQASLYS